MTNYILMDELHLQVRIPVALEDADAAVVRRHLASGPFRRRLVRAVQMLLAGVPATRVARIRLIR